MVKCVVSGCPNRVADGHRGIFKRPQKRFFDFPVDPARVKVCGLTVACDGSEDHLIHCFKEGEPCASGMELLAQARQRESEASAAVSEKDEREESDEDEEFANELLIEDDGDDDSD